MDVFLVITGITLFVFLCGCQPPPAGELNGAERAEARAIEVEAEEYAPDEFRTGQALLTRARLLFHQGEFRESRELALKSTEWLTRAGAVASLGKRKVARELIPVLQGIEEELGHQRSQVGELRRQIDPAVMMSLSVELRMAEDMLVEAQADFADGKYRAVEATLAKVESTLSDLRGLLRLAAKSGVPPTIVN